MAGNSIIFIRQLHLIQLIRSENARENHPSLSYLMEQLEKRFLERDIDLGFSEITIKRDIESIRKDFNIPIKYISKENGYTIDDDGKPDNFIENTLEAFEILSSVNLQSGIPGFIIPEKRKPKGVEHFHFLVQRIHKKEYIRFDYFKFDTQEITRPVVAPLALKESRNRWYLIGVPRGGEEIRAYGLDRISNPYGENQTFKPKFSIKEITQKYDDCFAMFTSEEAPQKVVLRFDKRDGNYIKSFPIHHSQTTEDQPANVIVTLRIKITLDFMMELMSRAWSVEVIEPVSLRETLHDYFKEATKRNE